MVVRGVGVGLLVEGEALRGREGEGIRLVWRTSSPTNARGRSASEGTLMFCTN